MSAITSRSYFIDGARRFLSARPGKIAIAFVLGVVLLTCPTVSDDSSYAYSASSPIDSPFIVVSLKDANLNAPRKADIDIDISSRDVNSDDEARANVNREAFWSHVFFSADDIHLTSNEAALPSAHSIVGKMARVASAARDGLKVLPHFLADYRSLMHVIALEGLQQIQEYAELTRATIVGTASTYNPYRESTDVDERKTASGEFYDPSAWTAAIQIKLRDQFNGVRFGRLYQPTFALVESGDKKVIVKINDVGPLKPGRVIDLNERTMRYFDPSLEVGLVQDVKITPLPGEDWATGPIGGAELLGFDAAG